MAQSAKYDHLCPGHGANGVNHERARLAICLQLSTLGEHPRRRARAITIYPCDDCVRLIMKKRGRALRVALARALQTMTKQLPAQERAA